MTSLPRHELLLTLLSVGSSALLATIITLLHGELGNLALGITGAVVGVLAIGFFTLGLGLLTHHGLRKTLLIGTPLAFAVAGLGALSTVIAAVAGILIVLAAGRTLKREIDNRIYYHTRQIFWSATRLVVMAFIIMVVGLSYPYLSVAGHPENLQLQPSHIRIIIKPFEGYVGKLIPGYRSSQTIDEFIDAQIQRQLPPGTTLSAAERSQLRQEISQQFGQELQGQDDVATIVANLLNQRLGQLIEHNRFIFPLLVVAVTFLALRVAIPIITWPVMGALAALVWLGRTTHVVQLTTTQQSVQRLTL